MDSLNFDKWLHADFLKEVLNFGFDTDYNVTCNGVLTKNMTLITIDRGWEGIPESFVINLILCVVRFVTTHFLYCYLSVSLHHFVYNLTLCLDPSDTIRNSQIFCIGEIIFRLEPVCQSSNRCISILKFLFSFQLVKVYLRKQS